MGNRKSLLLKNVSFSVLRGSFEHKSEFVKLIVLLTVYQSTCLVFPCDILFSEDCKVLCCLFQDKDFLLEQQQLQV